MDAASAAAAAALTAAGLGQGDGRGRAEAAEGEAMRPKSSRRQKLCAVGSSGSPAGRAESTAKPKACGKRKGAEKRGGGSVERPRVRVRSSKGLTAVRFVRGCAVHTSRVRVHVLVDCMGSRTREIRAFEAACAHLPSP
eukprot:3872335-Prymnesium_polylepis.1